MSEARRLQLEPPATEAQLDLESLLTAEQVACILAVRPKRVYELGLPTVRVSARALRYRRCDVAEFIEKRRTTA